mgnify:CR=1 FL=1
MPKRLIIPKGIRRHIPAMHKTKLSTSVSHIFDTTEKHGLTFNQGQAVDIFGQIDSMPNLQQVQEELNQVHLHTLRQVFKLLRPKLIITPLGSFLFEMLEKTQAEITSHIDFEYQNELTSEVLYYPQNPHFNSLNCLTKSNAINQNFSLFSTSFIEQAPKRVKNHSVLSLISQTRQSHFSGITLEQWIVNYLYEQMFVTDTKRGFTQNEIIFETVLPNSQSCIQIHFDSDNKPHIFPLNKFDHLDPSLTYRQVLNF